MSRERNRCESDCYDIDEWCPSCLDSCEFKVGDFIKIKDGNRIGLVEGISTDTSTYGWLIMKGEKVNPKFYRKYNGAIPVFNGLDAAGFPE